MTIKQEPPKEPEKPGPIPYFSTTIRDGVHVPRAQALFTGLLSAGFVFFLVGCIFVGALLLGADSPWYVGLYLALFSAGVVFFPVTFITWQRSRREFMDMMKTAITRDANNNGIPDILEEPEEKPRIATLYVTQPNRKDDGPKMYTVSFAERLPELARQIRLQKKNPTYENFGSDRAEDQTLFTRSEWKKLVDELLTAKIVIKIRPQSENSPIVFTSNGDLWLDSLIEQGIKVEVEAGGRVPSAYDRYIGEDGRAPLTSPLPQ